MTTSSVATAALYDFAVLRGNTPTWRFVFKDGDDPFDLTGSEMVFRVVDRDGSEIIRKSTADAALTMSDPETGTVDVPFAVDDSRALGAGKVNRYEFERRIGSDQVTLVRGWITGEGGVNDDA